MYDPVQYRKTSQPASNRIDADTRLFIIPDILCASRPDSGIFWGRGWSVSLVFVFDPYGCMMIFLSSRLPAVFSGARSSSKVTLADESSGAVVYILLGLAQPGSYIKLLTKLLFSNYMTFPAGAPDLLVGTHCLFQVSPPLESMCFAVVSYPGFIVVHVTLL